MKKMHIPKHFQEKCMKKVNWMIKVYKKRWDRKKLYSDSKRTLSQLLDQKYLKLQKSKLLQRIDKLLDDIRVSTKENY